MKGVEGERETPQQLDSQSQRAGLITLCMMEGSWISIGAHLLMVISYVSWRGGAEILHFGQKATGPPASTPKPQVLDPSILDTRLIS